MAKEVESNLILAHVLDLRAYATIEAYDQSILKDMLKRF